MSTKNILDGLDRVRALVENGETDVLERDLALDLLKNIYAELKFGATEVVTPEPAQIEVDAVSEDSDESSETESEPQESPDHGLFGQILDVEFVAGEENQRSAQKGRIEIRSLYGDDAPAPVATPPSPFSSGQRVVGEAIVGSPRLGDRATGGHAGLRGLTSFNDRMLMICELFDGNAVQYESAIDRLDVMPSLDDALIYIAENFGWSDDNEGWTLLFDLLTRRFS